MRPRMGRQHGGQRSGQRLCCCRLGSLGSCGCFPCWLRQRRLGHRRLRLLCWLLLQLLLLGLMLRLLRHVLLVPWLLLMQPHWRKQRRW